MFYIICLNILKLYFYKLIKSSMKNGHKALIFFLILLRVFHSSSFISFLLLLSLSVVVVTHEKKQFKTELFVQYDIKWIDVLSM